MTHFTVCYSNSDVLENKGYGRVSKIPFILDGRPGYHRLGSRFLIDRALGLWAANSEESVAPSSPPAPISLRNYAHWLCNFLEWAERRDIPTATCSYLEHVHGRYQTELLKGIWSRDGKALSPSTVNSYVQQACDFLKWMEAKGMRSEFRVPMRKAIVGRGTAHDSHGHKRIEVDVRQGKVRMATRRLRMPRDDEVEVWLKSVHTVAGQTLGLMAETILLTGLRRTEVVCLRVDTLPLEISQWHVSNPTAREIDQQILVPIKYGAKGPQYGSDHGDKIGPERFINIPRHLALKRKRNFEAVLTARG